MRQQKNVFAAVIAVAIVAALIGLGFGFNIVRQEGWEGVWNRKKDFIEGVQPGSKSALEEAEKRVGYQKQGERP